jgi:hypothetical protein
MRTFEPVLSRDCSLVLRITGDVLNAPISVPYQGQTVAALLTTRSSMTSSITGSQDHPFLVPRNQFPRVVYAFER